MKVRRRAEALIQYKPPDREALRRELRRAGSDENQEIAGSLWIETAAFGIGMGKTPADVSERIEKVSTALNKALAEMAGLPEPYADWLSEGVSQPIERSLATVQFFLRSYPGGHRESKHEALAAALKRWFVSENLPITISLDSPFVSIFANCCGMDPESAKTSLVRLGVR